MASLRKPAAMAAETRVLRANYHRLYYYYQAISYVWVGWESRQLNKLLRFESGRIRSLNGVEGAFFLVFFYLFIIMVSGEDAGLK